jgi:rhodanese-related sulfurtransferase
VFQKVQFKFIVMAMVLVLTTPFFASADDAIPGKSDQSCLKCHTYDKTPNVLAGKFVNVSTKAKTVQLKINNDNEIVFYDDATVLKNAENYRAIAPQESVKVVYAKKNGKLVATEIEVKKGLAVPPEQLITAEQLASLVAKGPEKGKYILLDSRPEEMYNQGHIPTALSMPFFVFDKLQETLLPKDKNITQIYYCAGVSCVLSPLAARKAEKLGYKDVKVFHGGMPEWKKAGQLVFSTVAGILDYQKNEQPYILIDVRPNKEVEQGHIPGAVVPPEGGLAAMESSFPSYKGAPIILYDQDGNTTQTQEAYKTITGWGYKQVSILAGGLLAWEKAGQKTTKGPASSTIQYVRKLMPGEIDIEVFKSLLTNPSSDTLILDVRLPSEAAAGAFPHSKHIPLDELEQRLNELPKDKKIILHCATGARAEMAYNILKKAGMNNVGYVKANIEFDPEKKGSYTISD